jgi:hypothetical protein
MKFLALLSVVAALLAVSPTAQAQATSSDACVAADTLRFKLMYVSKNEARCAYMAIDDPQQQTKLVRVFKPSALAYDALNCASRGSTFSIGSDNKLKLNRMPVYLRWDDIGQFYALETNGQLNGAVEATLKNTNFVKTGYLLRLKDPQGTGELCVSARTPASGVSGLLVPAGAPPNTFLGTPDTVGYVLGTQSCNPALLVPGALTLRLDLM